MDYMEFIVRRPRATKEADGTTFMSCDGKKYRLTRQITMRDIMYICKRLGSAFGEELRGEYVFEPDRIYEGGIRMVKWPEKNTKKCGYKAIRFCFRDTAKWPYIDSLDGLNTSDEVIAHMNYTSNFRIKSFYGAPVWTIAELRVFYGVMYQNGFKMTKTT